MKRVNRSGTVVKLSGKRRHPYAARVTVGYDDRGRQKQKAIGYFATQKEALNALALYAMSEDVGQMPDAAPKTIVDEIQGRVMADMPTVAQLYDKAFVEYYAKTSESNQRKTAAAWKRLEPIYNTKVGALKVNDVQSLLDKQKGNLCERSLTSMKTLITRIMKVAIREGYVKPSDDFSKYLDASGGLDNKTMKHVPFTSAEIRKIFGLSGRDADIVKCLILTGCRPNEVMGLPDDAFHLDGDIPYIVTGSKTEAGKNRVVPIHPAITDAVKSLIGLKISPDNFRVRNFKKFMTLIGSEHLPYDCRHTFASLANYFGMDPYCRKKILGHSFNDLTNDVYTHAYIAKLYNEICKIDLDKLPEDK